MLTRLIVALTFVASAASFAHGQPPDRSRVIEIDPIVVHGRRQAPAAFYLLQRASLGYEVTDLRSSFVRRIVESVRQPPF